MAAKHPLPPPYTPHPTHMFTHTRSRLAMAFPRLGIQCLMCFLLTMPMRKENVTRVQCPEPCLSRRHRMTCQTRNCSDLGNHCHCPSSSCHHSVVFLFGEYWLLLWTEKLSADLPQLTVPMTLCPDHRRQKLWHPKCPKWYAIFMLFFSFGFFFFILRLGVNFLINS